MKELDMARFRPLYQSPELTDAERERFLPKTVMDREEDKLLALRSKTRADDAISTRTRNRLDGGYAGTQVGGQTSVSGGSTL